MDWFFAFLFMFGLLMALMMLGMPVAFCFLVVSYIGVLIWWGPIVGPEHLITSIRNELANFNFLPLPLFIFMGEIMFRTGIASRMLDTVGEWMGKIPGRLSILAVAAGTLFATMCGTTIASVAVLGELLVPQMEKKGYHKDMILGPIMVSGGLAILIPPSTIAVLIGIIAEVSIAEMLLAIIMPGLLLATMYVVYIMIISSIRPKLAPAYEIVGTSISVKLLHTAKHVLPLGLIIFLVTGVVLLGIATPSEAAATGALGAFILAVVYRGTTWEILKKSLISTVEISCMMMLILMTSGIYSQILAMSGITANLSKMALEISLPPMGIIIIMELVLVFLGMFINTVSIMMITLPIFMPAVYLLGFDPIWFCVLFIINSELGGLTPPFGIYLYVMKGVAPKFSIADCVRSSFPYMGLITLNMILLMIFPQIVLWLPRLMIRQ